METSELRVLVELVSSDLRTGAANDALDLATLSRPLGLRFTLCGRIDDRMREEAARRGVDTRPGRSRPPSRWGAPLYALDVLRWMLRLRRIKPAVVHLDYYGWAPSLACAAYLSGIPVVSRAGGAYNKRNMANRWIKAYVANCTAQAASLLSSPLAPRVIVTGSLFSLNRLKPPFQPLRPIPPKAGGHLRLLFLGQLVERKGIDTLVAAFARMETSADLLLAGGDWNSYGFPRQIRDMIADLNIQDRVHLENHRPDVGALLDNCDIFVLPSRSEARPRTIIEALYLGKPVVASGVGGIPTLIEDGVTGLLVPPDRPDILAAALDRLAADEDLRRRLGTAGRAWAQAEVNPERAAHAHAVLYRRLVADAHADSAPRGVPRRGGGHGTS